MGESISVTMSTDDVAKLTKVVGGELTSTVEDLGKVASKNIKIISNELSYVEKLIDSIHQKVNGIAVPITVNHNHYHLAIPLVGAVIVGIPLYFWCKNRWDKKNS